MEDSGCLRPTTDEFVLASLSILDVAGDEGYYLDSVFALSDYTPFGDPGIEGEDILTRNDIFLIYPLLHETFKNGVIVGEGLVLGGPI
jgi:hypothetical protein